MPGVHMCSATSHFPISFAGLPLLEQFSTFAFVSLSLAISLRAWSE